MKEFDFDVLSVKVGSSMLVTETEAGSKKVDERAFRRIGQQLVQFADSGIAVVTTTSGAMAMGQYITGSTEQFDRKRAEDWSQLQRFANIGWQFVLERWRHAVCHDNRAIGAMLLTRNDLDEGTETRNEALRVVGQHISHGDMLFVNENDGVAHDEIAFGDNDILGAIFAAQITRTLGLRVKHISLTETNGIYATYTGVEDDSSRIAVIDDIEAAEHVIAAAGNGFGDQGMAARFEGAKILRAVGAEMYVGSGRAENAIAETLRGNMGTRFAVTA